jgi:uncharacterized protein GlcG (DUF336 family)
VRATHSLDYSEAQEIVDAVAEEALRRQQVVVVAVADPVDPHRRQQGREIGEKSRHPEQGCDIACCGDPRFVGWGGGIPVRKDGEVVGSVAVSGLSADEDIELATLGAAAVEVSPPSAT